MWRRNHSAFLTISTGATFPSPTSPRAGRSTMAIYGPLPSAQAHIILSPDHLTSSTSSVILFASLLSSACAAFMGELHDGPPGLSVVSTLTGLYSWKDELYGIGREKWRELEKRLDFSLGKTKQTDLREPTSPKFVFKEGVVIPRNTLERAWDTKWVIHSSVVPFRFEKLLFGSDVPMIHIFDFPFRWNFYLLYNCQYTPTFW